MGCCGSAGTGLPGMQNCNMPGTQNCNMPGMQSNGVRSQGVRTANGNQNIPPELAQFHADLGLAGS